MKTLVLNIDRDDDFGRKAKVKSPIIGIRDNIESANKLGQADPEDSDVNAIFAAIASYNELKKENKDVEIVTICGHMNVGFKSDEIISNQLDHVIKLTQADQVILISDGAEDEHILPIIESRIKIVSVKRVTVKQSKELEDTYYRIIKLLDDEKVQKQFVLPIALVLIVGSIFVLLDMAASGIGAILFTLGGYLLIRVFRWERNIAAMWEEVKSGFLTGKLSIYTYILAIVILIANGILAFNEVTHTTFTSETELLPTIFFVSYMIWGVVIAGLIAVFGRAVDVYVRDKKTPWKYWVFPFSLFTFGFIASAISTASYKALLNWPANFDIDPFFTINFIGYTTTGIMIALVGGITYHYIKDIYLSEDEEVEIETTVQQLVEKS